MAKLDLDKLSNTTDFKSDALGNIKVSGLTIGTLRGLSNNELSDSSLSSEDWTREFAQVTWRRSTNNVSKESSNQKFSEEEIASISTEELERFARNFIDSNYLSDKKADLEPEPLPNETECQRLRRLTLTYLEYYKKLSSDLNAKILESLPKPDKFIASLISPQKILGSSVFESIQENQQLSAHLKELTDRHSSTSDLLMGHASPLKPYKTEGEIPELKIPKNPIHDTNSLLEHLGNEFNAVGNVIASMNNTLVGLSTAATVSSKSSKYWNILMFTLGAISLMTTAVFSALAYNSSNKSSAMTSDLLQQSIVISSQHSEKSDKLISSLGQNQSLNEEILVLHKQLTTATDKIKKFSNEVSQLKSDNVELRSQMESFKSAAKKN